MKNCPTFFLLNLEIIYENSFMCCCDTASRWAKLSLILVAVGMGLQIAGYLTNNWMVYKTTGGTYDVRVGLWWMQNCSAAVGEVCSKQTVPDKYKTDNLIFLLVQCFEGTGVGILFITLIASAIYVSTNRCRTKPVAVVLLLLRLLAAICSTTGIILWVHKIVFTPYFPAWSMALCALAATLSLIACMCTIPDIYPCNRKAAVVPSPTVDSLDEVSSVRGWRSSGINRSNHDELHRNTKKRSGFGKGYEKQHKGKSSRQDSRIVISPISYLSGLGQTRDIDYVSRQASNLLGEVYEDLEIKVVPSVAPRYDYIQK